MNEGETELLAALARVVTAFEALDVDYLVAGSIASSVFGEPRQTVDADLVAHLQPGNAGPLVEQLFGEFYADLACLPQEEQASGHPRRHPKPGLLQPHPPGNHDQGGCVRSVARPIRPIPIRSAPEEVRRPRAAESVRPGHGDDDAGECGIGLYGQAPHLPAVETRGHEAEKENGLIVRGPWPVVGCQWFVVRCFHSFSPGLNCGRISCHQRHETM